MSKERFVAFFDAIMAIIMTIVVLEFVIPEGTKWSDLTVLGFQVLAYAVSFFWLGGMWIIIHNIWHDVRVLDRGVIWVNIAMLFFSSMIPFLVVYLGRNIGELVPQLIYGIDVLCITFLNELSVELLARHHECVKKEIKSFRISIGTDFLIKVIGIIVGVTIFPPAILISVMLAMIFLIVWNGIKRRKDKKTVNPQ